MHGADGGVRHVLRGRLMVSCPATTRPSTRLIADRDRFSYEGALQRRPGRVRRWCAEPRSWTQVSWESALARRGGGLCASTRAASGRAQLRASSDHRGAVLAEPAWTRGLGSANIDHRLRVLRISVTRRPIPSIRTLAWRFAAVDALERVAGHRLEPAPARCRSWHTGCARPRWPARSRSLRESREVSLSVQGRRLPSERRRSPGSGSWPRSRPVAAKTGSAVPAHLAGIAGAATVTDAHQAAAAALLAGPKRAVWLGALALRHAHYADLRALAGAIAQLAGATLGELAEGANAAGAYLAGCVPHRDAGGKALSVAGRDVAGMLQSPLKAYILFGGVEPGGGPRPGSAQGAGRCRTGVAVTPYMSEQLRRVAHVVLPIGTFAETSGTFVNWRGSGRAQRLPPAVRGVPAGLEGPAGAGHPAGYRAVRVPDLRGSPR